MTQANGPTLLEAKIAAWNVAIDAGDHEAALAAVRWLHEAKGLVSDAAEEANQVWPPKEQIAFVLQSAAFHGDRVPPALLLKAAALLLGKGQKGRPAKQHKENDDIILDAKMDDKMKHGLTRARAIKEVASELPGKPTAATVERRYRRIRSAMKLAAKKHGIYTRCRHPAFQFISSAID